MDQRNEPSAEQVKKIYSTPELTTYGTIEKLTEMGVSGILSDGTNQGSK